MADIVDAHVTLTADLEYRVARQVVPQCREAAQKIAAHAVAGAPVATGAYQAGIGTAATKGGAKVVAKDRKSAWIEFGIPSRGIPARYVLRRAVEAAGYKFWAK